MRTKEVVGVEAVSSYLRRFPSGGARRRLVCAGHAGAGASVFRPWLPLVAGRAELVALQLPGREDRWRAPLVDDVHEVAGVVAAELLTLRPLPLTLFGHSLGAAVVFEVAAALEGRGLGPQVLVVSGRQGPIDTNRTGHTLDDDGLWALVGAGGGTRAGVLASRELRELYLPILRSDYAMSERYQPGPMSRVSCPILACTGREDAEVDAAQMARSWAAVTAAEVEVAQFPGDHFYLFSTAEALVTRLLEAVGCRQGGPY